MSVGIPKFSPISYRYHRGDTYFWSYHDNLVSGWVTKKGGEWSLNASFMGGLTYSGTTFSGKNGQTTNSITIGNPFFNINYENDFMFGIELPGVPKNDDGSDRWRSGAAEISILGALKIGGKMMTGDPGLVHKKKDPGTGLHEGKLVYTGTNANDYRLGLIYLSLGPFSFGYSSEDIRHTVQNKWIHDRRSDSHHFQHMGSSYNSWYWYFGTGWGGSSLW